jgi:hypothetical protein
MYTIYTAVPFGTRPPYSHFYEGLDYHDKHASDYALLIGPTVLHLMDDEYNDLLGL